MTDFLLLTITILVTMIAFFGKSRLSDIDKKLTAVDTRLTSIDKELRPLTPAIVEIQSKFTEGGHSIMLPITVSPGSPLKLTEYGEKVLKDFGFHEVFKKARDQLISEVITMEPKTNYDIQEDAKIVIQNTFASDDPVFKPMKDYAYNNGLPVELVIPPASIVLRDAVMKQLSF